MTDRFEQEAFEPGEYERLQAEFDKEGDDLASAVLDEQDGDVAAALRVLAVKYLTVRHAWKQAKALPSAMTPSDDWPLASKVPMRSLKDEERAIIHAPRYGVAMTPAEELLKEIVQMTDNAGILRKIREYFEAQIKPSPESPR